MNFFKGLEPCQLDLIGLEVFFKQLAMFFNIVINKLMVLNLKKAKNISTGSFKTSSSSLVRFSDL